MNKEAYISSLQGLLPPGLAFNRVAASNLTKVLGVMAGELARIDARADDLRNEADPSEAVEMLEDWERALALPETCSNVVGTLQERILAVVDKLTRIGGQSVAYFTALAERMGYDIEITEFHPFICNIDECNDEELGGDHDIRFWWRVEVSGPRVTYFRCGDSECGDRLLSIQQAEDLECIFMKLKPAHTHLVFSYEGV